MAAGTVNHAPTPVQETAGGDTAAEETCDQLKARYGIETGTHKANEAKKSVSYQSHHILQGACTNNLIDYNSAMCVLLANSHSGTAHQITTARQNARKGNKTSGTGTQPAKNFGELKKLSKDDLVESLKKGKNIPDKDAQKLADCLVEEGEDKIKKTVKQETGEDVDDQTPVIQLGECFPPETVFWLGALGRVAVGRIKSTDRIEGRDRSLPVLRIDTCRNSILRIWIDGRDIAIAPYHRVRTADGAFVRSDLLRPGELVDTHHGPRRVDRIEHDSVPRTVFAIGVGEPFECRVGEIGLWAELPYTGVPVSRTEELVPFTPY